MVPVRTLALGHHRVVAVLVEGVRYLAIVEIVVSFNVVVVMESHAKEPVMMAALVLVWQHVRALVQQHVRVPAKGDVYRHATTIVVQIVKQLVEDL